MVWSNQQTDYLLVGDPTKAHLDFGYAPDGHVGQRLYAPDGVTKLIDFDAAAGTALLNALVTVARALSAASADTVPAAGIQSGTIAGLLTVGNSAAAHVEIGTNAGGESGIRAYDADGVTELLDIDLITHINTLVGKLQTALAGARIVVDPAGGGSVTFYSGDASETIAPLVEAFIAHGLTAPKDVLALELKAGDLSALHSGGIIDIQGSTRDGTTGGSVKLSGAGGAYVEAASDIVARLVSGTSSIAVGPGGIAITATLASGGVTIGQLAFPLNLVTPWTNMTNWQGGWAVGSPAPQWCKDAAGFVHFQGRITAGTLTGGTLITPTGNPPPAVPVAGRGRITVAPDSGPGELFIGTGIQVFNLLAGTTFIDLGNVKYYVG